MLFKKHRTEKARLAAEKTAQDRALIAGFEQQFEDIKAMPDESQKVVALVKLRIVCLKQAEIQKCNISTTVNNIESTGGLVFLLSGCAAATSLIFPPAIPFVMPAIAAGIMSSFIAAPLAKITDKKLTGNDIILAGVFALELKVREFCDPLVKTCNITKLVATAGDDLNAVFAAEPSLKSRFMQASVQQASAQEVKPPVPASKNGSAAERVEGYKKLKLGR